MNFIQSAHTWETNWNKKLDDRHMVISTVRSPAQPRRIWLNWTYYFSLDGQGTVGPGNGEITARTKYREISTKRSKHTRTSRWAVFPQALCSKSVTRQAPLAPKWLTDHRYSNVDIYTFNHCQAATCTHTNTGANSLNSCIAVAATRSLTIH